MANVNAEQNDYAWVPDVVKTAKKYWNIAFLVLPLVGCVLGFAYVGWNMPTQFAHLEKRMDGQFAGIESQIRGLNTRLDGVEYQVKAMMTSLDRAIDRMDAANGQSIRRMDDFIYAHVQAYTQSHVRKVVSDFVAEVPPADVTGKTRVIIDADGQTHFVNNTA